MKLSKTFLGIALSISSASVLVGAGVVINANSENIKSASATGSTGYVFIDISSAPASFEDSVYCHNWGCGINRISWYKNDIASRQHILLCFKKFRKYRN